MFIGCVINVLHLTGVSIGCFIVFLHCYNVFIDFVNVCIDFRKGRVDLF